MFRAVQFLVFLCSLSMVVGCSAALHTAFVFIPTKEGAQRQKVTLTGEILAKDGKGLTGCVLSLAKNKPYSYQFGTSEIESTAPLNHQFEFFLSEDGVEDRQISVWCMGELAFRNRFDLHNKQSVDIGRQELDWVANEIDLKGEIQNGDSFPYCFWRTVVDDNLDRRLAHHFKQNRHIEALLRLTYPPDKPIEKIEIGIFCESSNYETFEKVVKPMPYQTVDLGAFVLEKRQ